MYDESEKLNIGIQIYSNKTSEKYMQSNNIYRHSLLLYIAAAMLS
jgi:hypothetical protein